MSLTPSFPAATFWDHLFSVPVSCCVVFFFVQTVSKTACSGQFQFSLKNTCTPCELMSATAGGQGVLLPLWAAQQDITQGHHVSDLTLLTSASTHACVTVNSSALFPVVNVSLPVGGPTQLIGSTQLAFNWLVPDHADDTHRFPNNAFKKKKKEMNPYIFKVAQSGNYVEEVLFSASYGKQRTAAAVCSVLGKKNNDKAAIKWEETWTRWKTWHLKIAPNFQLSRTKLVFFSFYLTTWFPTSCGPPETSPQSTPGRAADGVRSGPPLIPGEGSRCCARCWSHGPTAAAASIRLKCRTGQPLRCAATSPEARLSAEFTEQRRTATTSSEETHTPTKSSGKFHVSSNQKKKKWKKREREEG